MKGGRKEEAWRVANKTKVSRKRREKKKNNAPETSENGSRAGDKSARGIPVRAARSRSPTGCSSQQTAAGPMGPAPFFIDHR